MKPIRHSLIAKYEDYFEDTDIETMKEPYRTRNKAWISSLLANEYKQGEGFLRNFSDEYCCLGVACDLYDSVWYSAPPTAVSKRYAVYSYAQDFFDQDFDKTDIGIFATSSQQLPDHIVEHYGLRSPQGGPEKLNLDCLSELNDGGYTFKEIADMLTINARSYYKDECWD